jgi:hypothetical protein
MSEIDSGGPAFPVVCENRLGHVTDGMSKREYFAAMAIKAQAYAEGRKAAAQDFRELLEMVNRLRHNGRYNGGLKWVVDFEQEFDAWKKARGIE